MTWEAVGAIAEALGAIGVLLTLLYLSIQVRANTEQTRLATVEAVMAREVMNRENLLDGAIPEIVTSVRAGRPLSPADELRLSFYLQSVFQSWESAWYMYRRGTLPADVYESIEFRRRNTTAAKEHWQKLRLGFTSDFRQYVEDSRFWD